MYNNFLLSIILLTSSSWGLQFQDMFVGDSEREEAVEMPSFMRRLDMSFGAAKALQENGNIPEEIDLSQISVSDLMRLAEFSKQQNGGAIIDPQQFVNANANSHSFAPLQQYGDQQFDGVSSLPQFSGAMSGDNPLSQFDGNVDNHMPMQQYGGSLDPNQFFNEGLGDQQLSPAYEYEDGNSNIQSRTSSLSHFHEDGTSSLQNHPSSLRQFHSTQNFAQQPTEIISQPVQIYDAPPIISLTAVRPKVYRKSKNAARRSMMCSRKRMAQSSRKFYNSYCSGR